MRVSYNLWPLPSYIPIFSVKEKNKPLSNFIENQRHHRTVRRLRSCVLRTRAELFQRSNRFSHAGLTGFISLPTHERYWKSRRMHCRVALFNMTQQPCRSYLPAARAAVSGYAGSMGDACVRDDASAVSQGHENLRIVPSKFSILCTLFCETPFENQ